MRPALTWIPPMFLVRSAFWLTVAFIVMRPHNVDLGATASAISGQALAAGQQMVTEQILKGDCPMAACTTPAVAAAIVRSASLVRTASTEPNTPSIDPTMQDSSMNQPAPFPRMRPAWMG
jgi:hypothetical protein